MIAHSLNNTSKSLSIENSIIAGMSLGTIISISNQSLASSERKELEMVKEVIHWVTDSMLRDSPIIQSPSDYTAKHPVLKQPTSIDHDWLNDAISSIGDSKEAIELIKKVMGVLDVLLQNEESRKAHESRYFGASMIEEKHLQALPESRRKKHSTIGVRGAIANEDIPAGSPLVYSAQYRTEEEWIDTSSALSVYLSDVLNAPTEDTVQDAKNRLFSYSFQPVEFDSQNYKVSAYGAGNASCLVNHDRDFSNMFTILPTLLDSDGNPTATVCVFFTKRNIKKGEQLLVDYGDIYKFHDFLDSRQTMCL